MTTPPIITTEGLTKRFTVKGQTIEAVSDLTVDVARGGLVAFLGPNGAGKTTSLRMLTTLLRPSEGTARVVGFDIATEQAQVRSAIGYVGQGSSGSPAQRVRDELVVQGRFYGLDARHAAARADELIESLQIGPFAARQVQHLSGGQKRRLDIALGLVHAPELLFLDEPSTGLDPQSRANLWQHILDLRARYGTTVFLTTHYLEEADRYAERVMVMDAGRVIADDTAARLKDTLAGDVLTFGFADPAAARAARGVLERVVSPAADDAVPRVTESDDDGGCHLTVAVASGSTLLPRVLRELDAAGHAVTSATAVPPTLDDVFLTLTGRSLREADAPDPAATAVVGGPKEEN